MLVAKGLGFFSLLSAVLGSPRTSPRDQHPQSRSVNATTEYDYIVVGSGAGGGPLAARLARGGYKVLLLDAGDDQGNSLQQMVPALQLQSTEYSPQSWNFYINHYTNLTRQEEDSKMTYRTPAGNLHRGPNPPTGSEPLGILYPRAGTLGGCTAHNAMVTVYPYESDWDNLAALTGNDSWAADKMRDYFRRLEVNRYTPGDVVSHGYSGWLQTSLTPLNLILDDMKLLSLVIAAGTAAGKNLAGKVINTVTGLAEILIRDANSGTRNRTEDLYQLPIAVKVPDYKRSGSRDFLLETVAETDNDGNRRYHLDIQLTTLVTNVVLDSSGPRPRAIGVDYMKGKSLYRADPRSDSASPGVPGSVYAAKEVILSGGSFNTPQLLKLSGIGSKAELDKWNISTLVDLPGVGTNLQDRYETSVIGKFPTDFSLISQCTFLGALPDPCYEKWKYEILDKGAYMSNNIPVAIIRQSSVAENNEPDLLISGAPANFQGYFSGYSSSSWNDARHWSWVTLKSRSRNNAGTVQLRSTDPRDTPIINFHSFDDGVTANDADQKDLQAVYEAMEFSRSIFKNLVPLQGGFEETWPGPNVTTEAEIKDFIKREAWGHHACCTAPIGADDDPMAVLDGDFRVRGVDGLRVVDASVFPRIPGYYLALPTYMISEKAADLDQKVPEFEKFLEEWAPKIPGTNYKGPNGPEKLGAHLMGRWKSGAPVAKALDEDNPDLAFDNKFDFRPKKSIKGCPFAAHIRKMRPRADKKRDAGTEEDGDTTELPEAESDESEAEGQEEDASVILRRGITFGPELTEQEKREKTTIEQRGIYFTCYQSLIRDGFNFLMTRWASNSSFPEYKTKTFPDGPGMDPFVNQRLRSDHPEGHISLYDGSNPDKTVKLNLGISPWVDQKGGEYFFTPSIKALWEQFSTAIPVK